MKINMKKLFKLSLIGALLFVGNAAPIKVASLRIENQNIVQAYATEVPIGTIMSWAKSLSTKMPALPFGWIECNGQTIADSGSPLNGVAIPNLNGSNYYMRGNSTSGGTSGAATHSHYIQGASIDSIKAVSQFSQETVVGPNIDAVTGFVSDTIQTESESNLPPSYDVVWIMRYK